MDFRLIFYRDVIVVIRPDGYSVLPSAHTGSVVALRRQDVAVVQAARCDLDGIYRSIAVIYADVLYRNGYGARRDGHGAGHQCYGIVFERRLVRYRYVHRVISYAVTRGVRGGLRERAGGYIADIFRCFGVLELRRRAVFDTSRGGGNGKLLFRYREYELPLFDGIAICDFVIIGMLYFSPISIQRLCNTFAPSFDNSSISS